MKAANTGRTHAAAKGGSADHSEQVTTTRCTSRHVRALGAHATRREYSRDGQRQHWDMRQDTGGNGAIRKITVFVGAISVQSNEPQHGAMFEEGVVLGVVRAHG
jgi:hypothetical protein